MKNPSVSCVLNVKIKTDAWEDKNICCDNCGISKK